MNNGIKTKGQILLVEDEVLSQSVISHIIKSDNYEVVVAPDGVVALMELGRKKFDLIISDIAMPNLDGYQLLEFIKKHQTDVPVVFLTGHTSEAEKQKGLQLGALEYISKPIDRKALLATINKIINR